MAKKFAQRKILVIDPKLQFRYLILPLLVTVTTSVCLFVFFLVQAEAIKSSVSEKDAHLRQQIQTSQMLTGVAVAAVLLGHVALIVWLGLTASHKLAGPLFRFKKLMRQVADGDTRVRVHLRKGDHLGDLADAFNEMMDAIERRRGDSDPPPG